MRGGVSLAVWIGGAILEIDRARRSGRAVQPPVDGDLAKPAPGDDLLFWAEVLEIAGYDDLVIDFMAGTSAGGLNAALYSQALISGASFEQVKDVWLEAGDLTELLESGGLFGSVDRDSVLDGDGFLKRVEEAIRKLRIGPVGHESKAFETFLTATVLGGSEVSSYVDRFTRDSGRRSNALFRFRHIAVDPLLSDLACAVVSDPDADAFEAAKSKLLAKAARTTASFPAAFEPVKWSLRRVQNDPPEVHRVLRLPGNGAGPQPGEGRLNFSEPSRSSSTQDTEISMVDGGVVDNIPVKAVLDAIVGDVSSRGEERWLLYLHPAPGVARPERSNPDDPPSTSSPQPPSSGMVSTLTALIKSTTKETVLDDIAAIEQYNNSTRIAQAAKRRIVQSIKLSDTTTTVVQVDVETEATQLVRLITEPDTIIRWTPIDSTIPELPSDSTVRSQVEEAARLVRATMQERLSATAGGSLHVPTLSENSTRPFAPLVRTGTALGSWLRALVREIGDSGDRKAIRDLAGDTKRLATITRLMHDRLSYQQALALSTIDQLPTVSAWAAECFRLAQTARRLPWNSQDLGEVLGTASVDKTSNVTCPLMLHRVAQYLSFDDKNVDLVADLWHAMGAIADKARVRSLRHSIDGDPMFTLFSGASDCQDLLRRCDQLDLALLGLHRGSAVGIPSPVRYARLSGVNLSPLATGFWESRGVQGVPGFSDPDFAPVSLTGDENLDGMSDRAKLAGSGLANFAAFASPRWRANDWMWGQLDSAKTLLDVILDPARIRRRLLAESKSMSSQPDFDPVEALVGRLKAIACRPFIVSVVDVDGAPTSSLTSRSSPSMQQEIDGAMRSVWTAQVADIRQELAALVNNAQDLSNTEPNIGSATSIPSPLEVTAIKRVLLTRRHLELMATELPEVIATPLHRVGKTGKTNIESRESCDPASQTLSALMAEYEKLDRGVTNLWGQTWLAALGVRAATSAASVLLPRGRKTKGWRVVRLAAIPIQVVLVLLAGAVLGRARTLFGLGVLVNVVIMPRLHRGWMCVVWGSEVAIVLVVVWAVHQSRHRLKNTSQENSSVANRHRATQSGYVGLAFGTLGFAITLSLGHLPTLYPRPVVDGDMAAPTAYVALAAAGGFVTVWSMWHWAKWWARLIVAVFTGFMFGFWARLSTKQGESIPVVNALGSFWWALLLTVAVTTMFATKVNLTLVASNWRVNRHRQHGSG